jgi:hypothetical protein
MAQLGKLTQRLELNLKPGAAFVAKVALLNKRMQGLTGGWERHDCIKLGLQRAVAFPGRIMANMLDAFF